jgi:hypothetical protein
LKLEILEDFCREELMKIVDEPEEKMLLANAIK